MEREATRDLAAELRDEFEDTIEQLRGWCKRKSIVYGSEIWDLDQIAEEVILKAKGE